MQDIADAIHAGAIAMRSIAIVASIASELDRMTSLALAPKRLPQATEILGEAKSSRPRTPDAIFFCKKIEISRRPPQFDDRRIGARRHARRHLIFLNLSGLTSDLVATQSSHRDLIATHLDKIKQERPE